MDCSYRLRQHPEEFLLLIPMPMLILLGQEIRDYNLQPIMIGGGTYMGVQIFPSPGMTIFLYHRDKSVFDPRFIVKVPLLPGVEGEDDLAQKVIYKIQQVFPIG